MNVHFYIDLAALSAAVLGLVPIYRDLKRKFFAIALGIVLVCAVALSVWEGRRHDESIRRHNESIRRIQDHMVDQLRGGRKTFDELAQSLTYKEVGQMSEALDEMQDTSDPRISYGDVALKNCDGSVLALVRRYYLKGEDYK